MQFTIFDFHCEHNKVWLPSTCQYQNKLIVGKVEVKINSNQSINVA